MTRRPIKLPPSPTFKSPSNPPCVPVLLLASYGSNLHEATSSSRRGDGRSSSHLYIKDDAVPSNPNPSPSPHSAATTLLSSLSLLLCPYVQEGRTSSVDSRVAELHPRRCRHGAWGPLRSTGIGPPHPRRRSRQSQELETPQTINNVELFRRSPSRNLELFFSPI
jgi:hypothetical protein